MPICFVSIFEQIRGPNAVYTPWEGQGAQAIAAGAQAVADGDVPCALVGGCDVKTHAFSFAALDPFGVWDSWTQNGSGCIPGEGAAFLMLENRELAIRRGARMYAGIRRHAFRSTAPGDSLADAFSGVFRAVEVEGKPLIVAAGDGDVDISNAEKGAIERAGLTDCDGIRPKRHLGNLFAAGAGVQVALAAALVEQRAVSALANCFGYGSEQASFWLEAL
jgi:3-oxoacyl-[acyl-carrier-protein] synthase II